MTRVALLWIVFMMLAVGAHADDAQLFGIGLKSCGFWLSNPTRQTDGTNWLLGFWTGSNYLSPNHLVGETTDAEGIIAAVKKKCSDDPTERLSEVTSRVYLDMKENGK